MNEALSIAQSNINGQKRAVLFKNGIEYNIFVKEMAKCVRALVLRTK